MRMKEKVDSAKSLRPAVTAETSRPAQIESFLRRRLWLVAIVALMVALRVLLLAVDAVPFNADEANVALQARHILQGERPVFFYGQAYLGSTDAWLVAFSFSIFGESVLAIRIVQIAIFAATLFTTFMVARRIGLERWSAHVAVLLMALPPTMLTLYTTASLGGYGETLLLGNLLILIALSIDSSASVVRWGILGAAAGFAFWTFALVLVYVIPLGLWLLWRHRLSAWRGYLVGLLGFAIGSAPWWLSILQLGEAPLSQLTGSAVVNSATAATLLDSLGVRLINFLIFGASAWIGLRYPWSLELVIPLVGIVVAAIYLTALYAAARRKSKLHEGAIVLWGMIGVLLLTYLLTSYGGDPSGRYLLPLYLPLSIFTALFLGQLRNRFGRLWVGVLITLIVAYNLAGTLLAASQDEPRISTNDAVTWLDHKRDQELIDFLLEQNETHGYTNYWVAFPIAFLSDEQIVSSARLPYKHDFSYSPRDDRYPPYTQAVRDSARAFYITTNHPDLDDLIREQLAGLQVTFEEERIGRYQIFYRLSRKVEPEELGLER